MKSKTLSFLFLCLFLCSTGRGQNSGIPEGIISKENASIAMIQSIFQKALYDVKPDPNKLDALILKDTWTIYVDLDKEKRFISLSVFWPINESFGMSDKFEFLNTIASEVLVVAPYYPAGGKTISIKYDLWIEGGIKHENLIYSERIFVNALRSILTKDSKKIIK